MCPFVITLFLHPEHSLSKAAVWLLPRLIWEYINNSSEITMAEVVDNLSGPFLIRMIHTRDGAQASCAVLRAGAAPTPSTCHAMPP